MNTTDLTKEQALAVAEAAEAGFAPQPHDDDRPADRGTDLARHREDLQHKAAIMVAKAHPRRTNQAYAEIIQACRRPGFAEKARYAFPRGGTTVSGPSVYMARELARVWGNIRYALRVVDLNEEWVHIAGVAMDLETNTYVEVEDRFQRLIPRKKNNRTVWIEPNERDLRELINRRGAICVRNALLQLLPADIVEDAERAAQETVRKSAAGELERDRTGRIRAMAVAFQDLAVTTDMLEEYLGHPLEQTDEAEIERLLGVYNSIRDGNSTRADYFTLGEPARDEPAADVNERLAAISDTEQDGQLADAKLSLEDVPDDEAALKAWWEEVGSRLDPGARTALADRYRDRLKAAKK